MLLYAGLDGISFDVAAKGAERAGLCPPHTGIVGVDGKGLVEGGEGIIVAIKASEGAPAGEPAEGVGGFDSEGMLVRGRGLVEMAECTLHVAQDSPSTNRGLVERSGTLDGHEGVVIAVKVLAEHIGRVTPDDRIIRVAGRCLIVGRHRLCVTVKRL
jgi:hypothetical protein